MCSGHIFNTSFIRLIKALQVGSVIYFEDKITSEIEKIHVHETLEEIFNKINGEINNDK